MKRKLYILLAILLLAGLPASAQMKRGGQKKEAPKTEKTTKKQTNQSSNSGKTKKSTKTTKQQSSNRSSSMTQAQKDRIIQQAIEDMVYVEGGTFLMGAPDDDYDSSSFDKPAHMVTLDSYYICKYEVTQALWFAVMDNNPSELKGNMNRPVERVTYEDCQKFLKKLNILTGRNFRLPTEAEWEFAARGGKYSRGYKYAGSNDIDEVSWYSDNSRNTTHPVGQKSPNELGLYDMSGNVWEWCYNSSSQTHPIGPTLGSSRVIRGGNFIGIAGGCVVWSRNCNPPLSTSCDMGLRLAL